MRKLDFGCGEGGFPGGFGVHPAERGSWLDMHGDEDTCAFDINSHAVSKARSRIRNGTCFLVADGRHLPFTDDCFDYVREWGTLHHIADYMLAVKEIARVLKPGGRFEAFETVDNDPFYSLCRTLVGNWKGNTIESRFKARELLENISNYFEIIEAHYWYRPLLLDLPSYFWDKYPGWVAGLYLQYYGSKLRHRIGLLPRFARHLTITAVGR